MNSTEGAQIVRRMVSVSEFLLLFADEQTVGGCPCDKAEYKSWSHPDKLSATLEEVGHFAQGEAWIKKFGYSEWHPDGSNYWSDFAPVALGFYPYQEATIYKCNRCGAVFLHYIEHGGHWPETRMRWARQELVHLDDRILNE